MMVMRGNAFRCEPLLDANCELSGPSMPFLRILQVLCMVYETLKFVPIATAKEDGTCTQMYYAKQGIITEEMSFIAASGSLVT